MLLLIPPGIVTKLFTPFLITYAVFLVDLIHKIFICNLHAHSRTKEYTFEKITRLPQTKRRRSSGKL